MVESNELNISGDNAKVGDIPLLSLRSTSDFLVRAGLLTEKRFNRIRIFRVNDSNPYTEILQRFLADWKSLDAPRIVGIAFNSMLSAKVFS